jgi:hypothetical protein
LFCKNWCFRYLIFCVNVHFNILKAISQSLITT